VTAVSRPQHFRHAVHRDIRAQANLGAGRSPEIPDAPQRPGDNGLDRNPFRPGGKLLADLGAACAKFHDETVRNVNAKRVQCDEISSFVYAKQKNVPRDMQGQFGVADVWTWTAIEAQTKLIVSSLVGTRDAGAAYDFMTWSHRTCRCGCRCGGSRG